MHRVLELLANAPSLPTACDDRVKGWIASNVQFHWLPRLRHKQRLRLVRRWFRGRSPAKRDAGFLSASSEAVSEMEITNVVDSEVRRYVIDRTFYDEASNARWIVDFKTAMPAEERVLKRLRSANWPVRRTAR